MSLSILPPNLIDVKCFYNPLCCIESITCIFVRYHDVLKRIAENSSSFFADYLLGRDDKTYIEITGLSVEVIAHIQQIINDIKDVRKFVEN